MKNGTKVRTFHFTIGNAGAIVDMIRQAYWYENRKEWGVETLKCLAYGIDETRMNKILHGLATLESSKNGERVIYKEVEDTVFIETLARHLQFIHDRDFITIAGYDVPRPLFNAYANGIVARLRGFTRKVTNSLAFGGVNAIKTDTDEILTIMELEEKRKEAHDAIFAAVNLNRNNPDSWKFSDALDEEVENIAGRLIDRPLYDPNEID